MRLAHSATAILISGIVALLFLAVSHAQQPDQNYELHGKVVNSDSGAGVPNALVQISGTPNSALVQFTDRDGSFVFAGLPSGDYHLAARKPGYFTDAELTHALTFSPQMHRVPSDSEEVLHLTPEGVIYGRVENDNSQPLDGIMVRAQIWVVSNGKRELGTAGTAMTDDEGQFRIAELKPGTYFLNFVPAAREGFRTFDALAKKVPNQQGYGSQYYPAAPDISSAAAIRIRPGSQVQVAQKMRTQKLYEVSGVVHGVSPEKGFQVRLSDSEGDPVQRNTHFDLKTGEFQIAGVPEGNYVLAAMAQDPATDAKDERPPLSAMMPIHLNADLTGVVLLLGRGTSIDVNVNYEFPYSGEGVYQIQLTLTSTDLQQTSQGLSLPPGPDSGQPNRFENVAPGTYEVEATGNNRGYVASMQCGDVDLLRDDLTVTAGTSVSPIEVIMRDDGAQVTVETTENGQPAAANVLLYSEEYPRKSFLLPEPSVGKAGMNNLRPGSYKVVAFKPHQEAEFRDPQAMQKYLTEAKEINLKAGDKVSLQLEVQSIQDD